MAKFAIIFALSRMFLLLTISTFPCFAFYFCFFDRFRSTLLLIWSLLLLFIDSVGYYNFESAISNHAVCLDDGIWNADDVFP